MNWYTKHDRLFAALAILITFLNLLESWFPFAWSIFGLVLYLADVGTDIDVNIQFLEEGHVIWATLTSVFISIPIIITCLWHISEISQANEEQRNEWCLMSTIIVPRLTKLVNIKPYSTWGKFISVFAAIIIAPIAPFLYLVWGSVAIFRGADPEGSTIKTAASIKFWEAMMESLPQAALQMQIIAQTREGSLGQWVSVVMSLITLAFAVSSNSFVLPNANKSSRVVFFLGGLLAVTSRLMVCCMYSMHATTWWFIPIGTEIIASIIVWAILRWELCPMCPPLASWPYYSFINYPGDFVDTLLRQILNAVYNCFTLSGLVISTMNLTFAVGCMLLTIDQPSILLQISDWSLSLTYPLTVITIALATVSFLLNVIFVTVPVCRRSIGDHWLGKDTEMDDETTLF